MAPPARRAAVRVVRALLLGGLLVVVVSLVWTAAVLLSLRDDLSGVRDDVRALSDGDGDLAATRAQLAESEEELRRARDRLTAPGPAVASRLPLLGRTPTAVRRTTDAALAAVRAGRQVLDELDEGEPLLAAGAVDTARLGDLQQRVAEGARAVRGPVDRLREVETGLTPSAVAEGVEEARDELLALPDDLADAAAALGALRSAAGADEPRELLVVLQNNAELRGTGGLISVFATARAEGGRITLGPFRDVNDVADNPGAERQVPAPEDFRALFGPLLADTTLWKNTNSDPDVARSSAVLAAVAGTTLGRPPDVVVWLDVPALGSVLAGTSDVTLPDGTELGAGNVVDALLVDAYREAEEADESSSARRARLRAAADAVAGRLLGGAPDLTRLSRELSRAASGRHLAVWSADPDEQAGWEAAGLAGALPTDGGDLFSMAVHNLGGGDDQGNKLDVYARRRLDLTVVLDDDGAQVEHTIDLANDAPTTGLPLYVSGYREPGRVNCLVLFLLPRGAEDPQLLRGADRLDTGARPLGAAAVLTDVVSLTPGTEASWTLRYRLPVDEAYRLDLLPQPLARDADLAVTLRTADGTDLDAADLPEGFERRDGQLRYEGPFDAQVRLEAAPHEPGRLRRAVDAVKRWWEEPVRLP